MNIDANTRRPNGMNGLLIIWSGQMISGIATSITTFALFLTIFGATDGSGAAIGWWEFFFFSFYLLVVQFAGVLIDRYDRKTMMLVYDFISMMVMATLLAIQSSGKLEIWHLYVAAIFQGAGFAFQSPSYSAAIATMIPRKQYVRANGLMALLNDAPGIFGPLFAAVLIPIVGLNGILSINLLAFVFSIGALLFVDVPPTPLTIEGERSHGIFLKEAIFGIKYIFKRPGLFGVQMVFFVGNLFSGMALSYAALYPMILLRSGNDTQALSTVQSAGALAAVVAGVFISTMGRIKRPVNVILMGWIISSVFGLTLLGSGQVLLIWLIAVVIDSIFDPVVSVSIDTFLQTKVPPDLQGRVFAASDFLSQAIIPVTPLLAGFFGDRIFEPAMSADGILANTFGWVVGTGPGAGYGLMIFLCGIGGALVGLWGYFSPAIRNVDQTMPDYEIPPPVGLVRREQTSPVNAKPDANAGSMKKPGPKKEKRADAESRNTRKK